MGLWTFGQQLTKRVVTSRAVLSFLPDLACLAASIFEARNNMQNFT